MIMVVVNKKFKKSLILNVYFLKSLINENDCNKMKTKKKMQLGDSSCPWLMSFWINTHLAKCFIVLISFFLFFLWSSIYLLYIIGSLIWVCLLNFSCVWTSSCWDLRNIHVQIPEIHLVSLPSDSLEAPWQWTLVFSKVKSHFSFHVKSYLIYPSFSYISLSIQIFNL